MAQDPEQQVRDQVGALLAELAIIDSESLVREQVLGTDLSFRTGLAQFERILGLIRRLAEVDLSIVPQPRLTNLLTVLTNLRDSFKTVATFTAAGSDPMGRRNSLLAGLNTHYETLISQGAPLLSIAGTPEGDLTELRREAARQIEELRTVVEQQKVAQSTATAEIEQTLSRVKTAAGEVGVSTHSTRFGEEADRQDSAGVWWLIATVALAVLTLAYTFVAAGAPGGFLALASGADLPTSLQLAVAKVLIFTVFISAVVWSGRNYRAARHNAVVNRHRQNALQSFETFASAARDDATKNAVLLRSTEAIFQPQPTGYISAEAESAATGSGQILEVIRSTVGAPKP